MAFSSALTLTDLNDFITPSQACIKPVEQSNPSENTNDPGAASTQIHIDSSGSYYEVSKDVSKSGPASRKLETAQISLNDCLACSGCITSAESVLITMQSHEEVFNTLSANPTEISGDHKTPVLSISPQSLASLAASISSTSSATVTLNQVLRRVKAFALEIGFEHVYDTTFARHIALLEHAHEFNERKCGSGQGDQGQGAGGKLPMLASACPGWVCYAEKTHAEMLPFISGTKSPQQVMGTLVKNWLGEKWGKKPDQIYHVTVMPCYDKKLEASRQDFYNDIYSTRDVDCVITTGELDLMMRARGWDLSTPLSTEGASPVPALALASPPLPHKSEGLQAGQANPDPVFPELLTHPGSSSGSYLHSLLAAYATQDTELTTRVVRAPDFEEYVLADVRTGRTVLRAARCYGFRNLQNLVRRVGRAAGVQVGRGAAGRLAAVRGKRRGAKAGASTGSGSGDAADEGYDYVEVMACPSGCVNGGGQLRPAVRNENTAGILSEDGAWTAQRDGAPPEIGGASARWGDREWTKRVEQAYWHDLPTPPPSPPLPASSTPLDSVSIPTSIVPSGLNAYSSASERLAAADALALRVLSELCQPRTDAPRAWSDAMDTAAEERRRAFFRTQYRAVESAVIGIQVQW
ncbi:hypothetical protein M0805_006340 [Coniferiporia weirii]|nr:hypothetical protein M0805_006340 [Coniferiporia weirii]